MTSDTLPPAGLALPDVSTDLPGPRSLALRRYLDDVECPAFDARREQREAASGEEAPLVVFARGEGCNLFDVDGNRYVDLAAGFGAVVLGHGAEETRTALNRQSAHLVQGLGDLYPTAPKLELSITLAQLHGDPRARVLLCQSGADAVTAAIKTAVLATDRPRIVAFEGAYHGLSYAPLAACGFSDALRDPFVQQLNPHVTFVPYPKTDADRPEVVARLAKALEGGDVAAVLVEPVLGRGGVHVASRESLAAIVALTKQAGALVIADEIWSGMGRCGSLLRMRELELPVDLVCIGKGLGGGVSIAACIGSDAAMRAWASRPGVLHTSTHAGSPLACAAALATVNALSEHRLSERAEIMGSRFRTTLADVLGSADEVIGVRGAGLLVGVELADGGLGLRVAGRMLRRGFVVTSGGRAGEVIVMTPPLVVGEAQLSAAALALAETIAEG